MLQRFTYGPRGWANKALAAAFLGWMPFAAMAEPVEVLALGDSLTQGYGLVEADGLVPQLNAWLDAQGADAVVINGGVSGDTTAGGLSRVEWSLTPQTQAMIVALGGNDVLRGIAPEEVRANIDGILDIARKNNIDVLLVGMVAPGNYGPDYKAAFDTLYPDLSARYDTLYMESFFSALLPADGSPAGLQRFMQADGIHPNAQGVETIVKALGPMVIELLARAED